MILKCKSKYSTNSLILKSAEISTFLLQQWELQILGTPEKKVEIQI